MITLGIILSVLLSVGSSCFRLKLMGFAIKGVFLALALPLAGVGLLFF